MTVKAIILSAGKSSRLKELTKELPKTCLKINNEDSILSRMLKILDRKGFNEAILLLGYAAEKTQAFAEKIIPDLKDLKLKFLLNDDFENKDNIYSVYLIKELLGDDTLVFNSDIVFDERILEIAIKRLKNQNSFLMIDDVKPLIDEDMKVISEDKRITRISKSLNNEDSHGEYIGIMHICTKDKAIYGDKLNELISKNDVKRHYEYALDQVLDSIEIKLESTQAYTWTEVDTLDDLERAQKLECINMTSQSL
jgi:choline kinase